MHSLVQCTALFVFVVILHLVVHPSGSQLVQAFDWRDEAFANMPPKFGSGGAGNKSAQNYVTDLWQQGLTEAEAGQQKRQEKLCVLDVPFHASAWVLAVSVQVRQQLKNDGYKGGRISQLLKATRPVSVVPAPVEDVSWRKNMWQRR